MGSLGSPGVGGMNPEACCISSPTSSSFGIFSSRATVVASTPGCRRTASFSSGMSPGTSISSSWRARDEASRAVGTGSVSVERGFAGSFCEGRGGAQGGGGLWFCCWEVGCCVVLSERVLLDVSRGCGERMGWCAVVPWRNGVDASERIMVLSQLRYSWRARKWLW